MTEAGLDKVMPIHAPAHQAGNFKKVQITPRDIFHVWAFDPCERLDLSPSRDHLIHLNDLFATRPTNFSRDIVIMAYRQSFSGNR
jgi:hypothetical protein